MTQHTLTLRYLAFSLLLALTLSCGGQSNSTSSAPQQDSVAQAKPDTVQLLFAGDAMQHMPQVRAAQRAGGRFDYSDCLRHIVPDVKQADFAVVNLECPLAGKPYTGYPAFGAPDAWGKYMVDCGFDLILTANNHCLDRGAKGLRRTIATLDGFKVPHVGTYVDSAARRAQLPCIITVKGIKIAFLDYTYGTNGISPRGGVVVDYIDRDRIGRDIDEARQHGAQAICVNLHWGIEYKLSPVKSQITLADYLVSKGVDLIIGGHPHVVEPFEMRYSKPYGKQVLLVYSLGNMISAQRKPDTQGGALVKVALTLDSVGNPQVVNPRYKLFFCQHPVRAGQNFTLIPEDRPDLLRPDAKSAFTTFMRRTHSLVMSHNKQVPQE